MGYILLTICGSLWALSVAVVATFYVIDTRAQKSVRPDTRDYLDLPELLTRDTLRRRHNSA